MRRNSISIAIGDSTFRQRARIADGMLREYPRIPAYEGGHSAATAS